MGKSWTVLVVEPDKRVNELIQETFRHQNLTVVTALTSRQGLRYLKQKKIDLVIMEARLPEEDDFSLLVKIRQFTLIPVMIVSQLVADAQRVQSFQLGADDYLAKPFNPQELWLRAERLLNYFYDSSPFKKIGQHYVFAFMTFNPVARQLLINNKDVQLTPRESSLLSYFVSHPDEVISRQELLQEVWGYHYFGEERTVDVHIRKLRQKLGKYSTVAPQAIVTVWQRGYRFDSQPKPPLNK